MHEIILYIGNKNLSSWSFRAWLALRSSKLQFTEKLILLDRPDTHNKILEISPSGRVPCLHHNDLMIWDSLAICEYINELSPNINLYPQDRKMRAVCRSVCAEMHSSFMSLRKAFPMNMKEKSSKLPNEQEEKDIKRILEIWENIKLSFGKNGPYLFGEWTVADIFFAPVVSRFISYNINIESHTLCQEYVLNILNNALYQEWYQEAIIE